MATLSECSVCIHCVSCAHANQLMFFCVLTYACLHDLTTHLSSSGTLVMWAGIQTQVLMWVPPFIYTHTQASTVVTCVVAAWWNRTNLALVASCSASENLHRRNLEIFCQVKKNICRLHLCNADSVGNNVAVTLSSAFLVLATFTVCYWIIYDTLLYDLQLIKTYLFKALCVYFTDPKCIRMMDSDLIRPRSVMSLQAPFRYILDPFTVTYCPDKIRIHF